MGEFVEVKVSELEGNALRWAVGKADKLDVRNTGNSVWVRGKVPYTSKSDDYYDPLCWGQCGPLFDKHCSALNKSESGWWAHAGNRLGEGETAMVAICRSIAATKFGEVALVPTELVEGL